MSRKYVEKRNGGYYLVGSRVTLESAIHPFLEGASPEAIVEDFPSLTLEQVYGAITFYLANREEMDAYLAETNKLWNSAHKNQHPVPSRLRERLERARRELAPKHT